MDGAEVKSLLLRFKESKDHKLDRSIEDTLRLFQATFIDIKFVSHHTGGNDE